MIDPIYKGPPEIDAEDARLRSDLRAGRIGLMVNTGLLMVSLGLTVILFEAATNRFPLHRTVYTSNAAAVCAFAPVAEPGPVSEANVRDFASRIAIDLHALDYANWRKTLDRVTAESFTPQGRASVVQGMRDSGILPALVTNNFVGKPVISDAVSIMREGVQNGVYTWIVQVPLTLAYIGSTGRTANFRPENRTLLMTVTRAPVTADNPEGLKVDQLYSTQTLDTSAGPQPTGAVAPEPVAPPLLGTTPPPAVVPTMAAEPSLNANPGGEG